MLRRLDLTRPQIGDLVAGLSVVLALVPQGLAYAELAGMPGHIGLLAGTLPAILAAFFVSSPYLQTGPTALTSLLVAGALTPLAAAQTDDYVLLGALLALMVGVARVVFGALRLGIAAYFVSQPVLTGFTSGAALLIMGSQLPTVAGYSSDSSRVLGRALATLAHPGDWNWASIMLAVITFVLIVTLRKVHQIFPSVLLGVAVSWAIAAIFDLDVATVGDIPSVGVSLVDELPFDSTAHLIVPAIVIALIGFAEPSSIARTYAAAQRQRWSANAEFVSQGVANLAAGAIGSYPVGGSFGRSSLNYRAGATTRWSGFITGVAMLVLLPFSNVLSSMPKSALAAVVISSVMSLFRLDRISAMWSWSRPQTAAAAVTLVATLAFDPRIERGILVGVALSVGIHLWRELQVYIEVERTGDHLRIVPHGVLWFGSINRISEKILAVIADHPDVDDVEIVLGGIGRLDLTAAFELAELAADARKRPDLDLRFSGVPPHAERLFSRVIDTAE
ncbi:MAG: SulP family inorganic anion transporter [Acidimicrobiales bacterium]